MAKYKKTKPEKMILPSYRLTLVFLILIFLFLPAIAKGANLTGGDLIENKLKDISDLPNREIDLFETLLLISRHWDPNLKIQPLRQEINSLVSELKKNSQSDANTIIESLRN